MEKLVSKKSKGGFALMTAGCLLAACALIYHFQHFSGIRDNAFSGFALGILLLLIALWNLVLSSSQVITVDPQKRMIIIEDEYLLFGKKVTFIAFEDIKDLRIGRIGRSSNYVVSFYIEAVLSTGKVKSLFVGHESCSDHYVVEGFRSRLLDMMRQDLR